MKRISTLALAASLAVARAASAQPVAHLNISAVGDGYTYLPEDAAPPSPVIVLYSFEVTNHGPSDVVGAQVTLFAPFGSGSVTWSCVAWPGSSCPSGGASDTGVIPVNVNLPLAGRVNFWLRAVFLDDGPGQYQAAITVNPPAGTVDPNLANNVRVLWSYARPRPGPYSFYTLPPCRVIDTRTTGEPLVAGETRNVQVAGTCGIPSDARAVALNVTVMQQTEAGHFKVYSTGRMPTPYSIIRFDPGRTRSNLAFVSLAQGATGVSTEMHPWSTGHTHFAFDVFGYFK